MSGEKATGGCAFPFNAGEFGIEPSPGMTLRDWFAGQALSEVMAVYATANGHMIGPDHFPRNCAEHAYRIADAMLVARSK